MKINKFKKVGKNKYKVFFDFTDITLYEDIILKYDLLIKSDIDTDLLEKIVEENKNYDCYNIALDYIEIKMRNKKELYKYLSNKEFSEKLINETINKIESLGLLDNNKYIKAYINDKINLSNDGPYKIKNSLLELDFDEKDIDDYLYTIEDKVWEDKLIKLINKKKHLMNNKSYYMFISKMKNDLYNLGYEKEMIDRNLSDIEYVSNALENDFNKVNKKFKGDKTKIINSLLRKGYSYEDINNYFKDK